MPEAEQALRTALKADPQMAAAAFNLGVLLGDKDLDAAIALCQQGARVAARRCEVRPHAGVLQRKKGDLAGAIELLREVIQSEPSYLDAYLLLGEIYEERHDAAAAAKIYLDAARIEQLPPETRDQLEARALRTAIGPCGQVACVR